ncbi:MAG: hypothetical protein U9R01_05290, partial [candidate division WOR-3 bacterium]|nr:hypothetical protein [candidate division WOR-3 bacterium]
MCKGILFLNKDLQDQDFVDQLQQKKRMREQIFRVITDERILIVIAGIAFFWRSLVSLDKTEALWECICSGISLFIIGWALFAYMCSMSRKPTSWPVTNKIYHWVAICLLVLNIYVAIYYGLRWVGLLHIEVSLLHDSIFRDIRYVMFVTFYCAIIGSARYFREMHENYRSLIKGRLKKPAKSMKEFLFGVITNERTLIAIIAAAILWRIAINSDHSIAFWESVCSCIILLIMGWFLFGYISALTVKVKATSDLAKACCGVALALCAINVYTIFYYGIKWYGLIDIAVGNVPEIYVPQLLD